MLNNITVNDLVYEMIFLKLFKTVLTLVKIRLDVQLLNFIKQ